MTEGHAPWSVGGAPSGVPEGPLCWQPHQRERQQVWLTSGTVALPPFLLIFRTVPMCVRSVRVMVLGNQRASLPGNYLPAIKSVCLDSCGQFCFSPCSLPPSFHSEKLCHSRRSWKRAQRTPMSSTYIQQVFTFCFAIFAVFFFDIFVCF